MNWAGWATPMLNHLWQSTVFAGGVWLLTLALRHNAARTRYRLWMAASLKFLIPFSLLMVAGEHLPLAVHPSGTQPMIARQTLLEIWGPVGLSSRAGVTVSGTTGVVHAPAGHGGGASWPLLLIGVWGAGTLLLAGRWARNWMRLRSAVRRGEPVTLAEGVRALVVDGNAEPGVVGILQPVLVLPRGIAARLTAEQMDAIVAHERCHMERRDNLTAALHMAVEALFWFHPGVWWMGTRLLEERERACDEAVLEGRREPLAYAEGILNVCKFYMEAPLSCVSGVTGSELKKRIARILSGKGTRKLDWGRKALLTLACALAVGVPVTAGVVRAAEGQTAPAAEPQQNTEIPQHGIVGNWQGTMHLPDGRDLRVVLKLARDEKGALGGAVYMIDADRPPLNGGSVSFSAGTLRFTNFFPGWSFEGKMSADGSSISGTVTQNGTFPLVLERATPETEWAIPAAPPRIPPMAADAKPGIEVATVKPTQPGSRGFMISARGGDIAIQNQTLMDLIRFAYEVQEKQVLESPGWVSTERWDIQAKPDTAGMPSGAQIRELVQRLLAERFSLKVHSEKREMAAYALTVGKDGAKLTKSADNAGPAGFTMGPLGTLHAGNASMEDFAHILENGVLDRPVLDQTGLSGKWDFTLKWTPDESQFAGMPVTVPPPPADANAAPPFFAAMREQLGLQVESKKAEVPVVVVDHVEKPSPN